MGIRLWLCDRQGHEGLGFGAGDQPGRDPAQGRSAEVPGLLASAPPSSGGERIEGLAPEAGWYWLVVQAVGVRPPVLRAVVRAEQPVDPREVDGEVLVDRLFLRRVMAAVGFQEDQRARHAL